MRETVSRPRSPARRACLRTLLLVAGAGALGRAAWAAAPRAAEAFERLRLADLAYQPEPELLAQAWRELASEFATRRALASTAQVVRLLKRVARLYTWQSWNFEYLDASAWLEICAANHALFAEYGRLRSDAAFARGQAASAFAKLGAAVTRAATRLPPRDPAVAVAAYRELLPPPPPALPALSTVPGYRPYTLLWGDLHIHSALSYDAYLSPAHSYRFARDVMDFDFAALTDHAFYFGHPAHPYFAATAPTMFAWVGQLAGAFAVPGRFATLTGLEWEGRFAQGHRNLIFAPEHPPALPYALLNPDTNSITRLWAEFDRVGERVLSIAHHPGYAENAMGNALLHWNDRYQRVIEIASDNGLFERAGDPVPATAGGYAVAGRTVQDALNKGMRLGIVGASDGHCGTPGLYVEGVTGFGGRPGFTAAWATDRSAAAVYAAVQARRCYATDGQRINLAFLLNGQVMGSELVAAPTDPLHFEIAVAAAARLREVELLRNEAVLRRWAVDEAQVRLDFTVAPDAGGDRLAVSARSARTSEQFRVCVRDRDGRRAWSSPIWVDYGV